MLTAILNAFKVPELRRRLAFTALILLLYRAGSWLPTPGVDTNEVQGFFDSGAGSTILGYLNLFSGQALQNLSLFALGIMPYITASIIMQLMQVVVPSLEKLQQGGRGRAEADHAVHALPHGRARGAAVRRLRVPVPQRVGHRRVEHPARPHGPLASC